jgi:two-component system phosphate regulon sensor histidine kinase PhoR
MKQRMVILAMIMLTIALTGLMVIQGYWVFNAYSLKQANFVQTVSDAAHTVILTMEKMEIVRSMQEPDIKDDGNPVAVRTLDSANVVLLKEMRQINTKKDLEVFMNKFFITRELIEERMFSMDETKTKSEIDTGLLESLLNDEFNARDLNMDWQFGVFNPFSRNYTAIDPSNNKEALLDPRLSFHYELFPDDQRNHPDFLLLYFPQERQYLFGQVWPLVATSVILILIIIFSFTYTFIMYFRQGKLSELKTDFINNMTHEFKTPVSTISLACEALNDKDIQKSEALYQSYINIINEENKRLGMMAERILQSAALEKGDLALHKEKTDLHEVLDEVIRNIGIQIEIKDGQIVKDYKAVNSMLEVDRMHLVNLVQNLLDNANKYTPVRPQIIVSTRDTTGGVIFSVQDNGIGISKADQKKIFEKLYRVPEGNVHNFKGFGLGLHYVKTVVESHGGTVKLESELKKGTKFEVFFPFNHRK